MKLSAIAAPKLLLRWNHSVDALGGENQKDRMRSISVDGMAGAEAALGLVLLLGGCMVDETDWADDDVDDGGGGGGGGIDVDDVDSVDALLEKVLASETAEWKYRILGCGRRFSLVLLLLVQHAE